MNKYFEIFGFKLKMWQIIAWVALLSGIVAAVAYRKELKAWYTKKFSKKDDKPETTAATTTTSTTKKPTLRQGAYGLQVTDN